MQFLDIGSPVLNNRPDREVEAIIQKEIDRQNTNITLIASENYASPAVLSVMGSVFTNKYAEGYPKHRYYEGCEYVDEIETLAKERLNELLILNTVMFSHIQVSKQILQFFLLY